MSSDYQPPDFNPTSSRRLSGFRVLTRAAREVAAEPDPIKAVWKLLCFLRSDLKILRAGVFLFDPVTQRLEHIAGVSMDGQPEFGVESFSIGETSGKLLEVARREVPYYFTNQYDQERPQPCESGVTAKVIVPIIAHDTFLGTLCADNGQSGEPIRESTLDPLFIYAGLAALPLFALLQAKEQERAEALRRRIHREVLFAVSSGKICLCDRDEIDTEWPMLENPLPVERPEQVGVVREVAKKTAIHAGMSSDRAADFSLCVSEAVTNALLHGHGGYAAVATLDDRVRVRVVDRGGGIDPEDLPRATLLKGWSKGASMGLGFTVINETADRLYLHTDPAGTTIIIEMSVHPEINLPDEANPLLWGEAVAL